MERLTEYDTYGNADIIGVDSMDLQCNLECDEFNKVTYALNKLAEYETLEEQGKLQKLPCAVGDTVYRVNKGAKEPIIPMTVLEIGTITAKTGGLVIQIKCRDNADKGETYYFNSDFGKNVFFSKEESESVKEGKCE